MFLAEVADDILLFLERHSPYAHTLRLWSIHLGGGEVEEKKGDKGETKTWVKFVINLQSHTTLLFHVAMVISRPIRKKKNFVLVIKVSSKHARRKW